MSRGLEGFFLSELSSGDNIPPLASIVQQEDPQWLGYSDNPPKLFVEEINIALDESLINMSIAKSAVDIIWMHYRFTALIIMLHIVLHKGKCVNCSFNRCCILKIILIYLTIFFWSKIFFLLNEEAYGCKKGPVIWNIFWIFFNVCDGYIMVWRMIGPSQIGR